MPGTTRYSATFDRTYEEEAKPSSPPNARRSRSQSWQANSGHDGRQYTPFASRSPAPRSSSTDNSPNKGTEFIPTRTAKTSVKAHNNPFQFVKVGTCPLYKKAEEQLKKAKEVKKPEVLKEEEEEWQTNLDSWKSRRRKMSEDVFRRQEEIKLLELEEQIAQVSQKKTKTFSEMVESRATRGRALSLCLLTSPLEFQNWEFENKTHKNGSCSFTDDSGENSTVNSEDEGVSVRRRHGEASHNENEMNHRTNGDAHIEQNGSKLDSQNGNCIKLTNNVQLKPKENSYIDSGLESISSSHRAGDTPDSGSDFSQDSNSSIDCDSPRTGVNVLEEFTSKSSQISEGREISINLHLGEKGQDFGFTFLGGKDEGQVIIASILEGSKAESSGIHLGDRIITIDSCDVNSKKHIEIAALIQKGREKGQMNLLLWRHTKSSKSTNGLKAKEKPTAVITDGNLNDKSYEKSIESENEMYVDDFEELKRQSEILANKKTDTACTNAQAETNGTKSPNKDTISLKIPSESSTASSLKTNNTSNNAVEEPDKNQEKAEINSENPKKNIIKVKRVRRKGVYALNVDSNQNSQEGNSTNFLFPLSPVTELPSPADENKTVSSALSSNTILPSSNYQNAVSTERKQNGVEIKPSIPIQQENNTIMTTSPKTESSKSVIMPTSLKTESSKSANMPTSSKADSSKSAIMPTSSNTDSSKSVIMPTSPKTESSKCVIMPTSPKTRNSKSSIMPSSSKADNSKSAITLTSSKIDSSKSAIMSMSTKAESSESAVVYTDLKNVENKAQLNTENKTEVTNAASLTSKSESPQDEKRKTLSSPKKVKLNKLKKENSIVSPECMSVPPATELVTAPIKTPASSNAVFNNTGTQSSKVIENNVEAPTTNKQSKISASEDNKSKKNIQKKIIVKPKGNTTEKISSGISTDATLNEIYSTKEQNSPSVIEKPEKMSPQKEIIQPSSKEENSILLNGIANVSQDLKLSPEKDETPIICPSTNKVRDLALKFGEKSSPLSLESPVAAKIAKPIKASLIEKSKPVIAEKKENTKAKENCAEQNLINTTESKPSPTSSITSVSSIFDSASKNITVQDKQIKIGVKDEVTIAPPKREKSVQQIPSVTPQLMKETSKSSVPSASSVKNTEKENKIKKETVASTVNPEKQPETATKNQTVAASPKREKSDGQVPMDNKQVTNKTLASSVSDPSSSKNPIKGIQLKKEKKTTTISQDEQVKTVAKNETKVSPLTREKSNLSLDIGATTAVNKESQKLPSPVVSLQNPTPMVISDKKSEFNVASSEFNIASHTVNSVPKSPIDSPEEKPKLPIPKRSRNRSKKKNANSQKVNTTAKLNEESKNSNDSLNIVFQSQPNNMGSETIINNNKNFENNNNKTSVQTDLVTDVPPVDKIAEEMEKLILEQLEEEERAKELSSGKIIVESSPEHLLTAPPRLAEPPKEKPPPPPSNDGSPKDSSLKRVNSTKRIKKEIHKRRSNFLGIENADESIICNEPSVPPPPALEEILKAEMELDRQSRLRIESEATKRLSLEEKEIMQKEREIIESIESEERHKLYLNGMEDCNSAFVSNTASDVACEQNRIQSLKCERKRIDTERQLTEEQQQMLLEEKQLKERVEFIKQQEAAISTMPLSDSSLSVSANTANNFKKPEFSSVPNKALSSGLLLGANGDGNNFTLSSTTEISVNETSKSGKKVKASEKPAVPPKPLKKKEAIRKERERLRQEQEALQREREEHRRKLMQEQEELMKHQKSHAPDAPASRLGPHPPHVQPSFPPQLTTTMNATPNARENASFPSRSHHGTSNGAAGSINAVELMGPPIVRQNRLPAPRKAVQNEAWGQQKMPSVRKQNHESLTESRYNQNHWLIQEAEMRRITELKDRQRTTQPPCTQTHLAEDDVCSNPPRVPVISPTHNPHLNYPVQEKVWNYGQPNMPLKKYPPPVVKEPPLHTIYSRETVPQQPPTKPSRVVPSERQEQMLSVSGRKRCSHCNEELGRGAAMIIESLQLYYHIHCFQCCVCQAQLGNGSCGTDVRVRNNKLHCHNCYSNDEAGLKFSQV